MHSPDRRVVPGTSRPSSSKTVVWHDLCALLRHPAQIAYALERAYGGHWLPQELQARKEALRKGRVTLETQIDRLTQAYLADIIPLAEYQLRQAGLGRENAGVRYPEHPVSRPSGSASRR